MCRFVAYLGQAIPLARVVSETEHSLVVQSYQPREMTSGVVNADGFGVGWYNRALDPTPCVYTNITPIWSDRNLPGLSKHIASDCIFANVRSATPGQAVDQSNCQPFAYQRFLFMHNGYIENFRQTLMRRIRETLRDEYYSTIGGTTDSEHVFALFLNFLHARAATAQAMSEALHATIRQLALWARPQQLHVALNLAVTNGESLVVSRFSTATPAPSLYYQQRSALFPNATIVASERLSSQVEWNVIPESCVLAIDHDLRAETIPLSIS
ncbi:MAG: ergothioneine biosynthesis protein EgtC [Deltaproteobacteria bacterium]|nr:ergothioneine biosynthesis protein EgtC [Deltaproteobacteria bacterium]